MHSVDLESLVAIILCLGIPIVAIIGGIILSIRKNRNETELRRLIIENQTDLETAKALIAEPDKKLNMFGTLRGACVLIGVGLGAFVNYLLNLPIGIYFWIVIAFGVGLGLLVSFFVEMKLQKRMKND